MIHHSTFCVIYLHPIIIFISLQVHITDMAVNAHVYKKFYEARNNLHQLLAERKSTLPVSLHITEYSRLITDWLMIAQYLEMEWKFQIVRWDKLRALYKQVLSEVESDLKETPRRKEGKRWEEPKEERALYQR